MNSRELRAMRKDKAARKFAALAVPEAPPVEFDELFFQRADLSFEALKASDCATFGQRAADLATAAELARNPRGGYAS